MFRKWTTKSILRKSLKRLSGYRFVNSTFYLLPSSVRLRLTKSLIFVSKSDLSPNNVSKNHNTSKEPSDEWGNVKYREYATSQVRFHDGTEILIAVGSLAVSGGTSIILEYAHALQQSGANVSIGYMRGKLSDSEWHHLSKNFRIQHLNFFKNESFDLGIMTWWKTVEPLLSMNCKKFVYFVQSLESRFAINSRDSDEEIAAASTYLIDIPMITVALWLQNVLIASSKTPTWRVKNGIDKEIFPLCTEDSWAKRNDSSEIRYLVEGTYGIPMKAVAETLQVCSDLGLKSVTYINPGLANPEIPGVKVLNQIPTSKMYEIYLEHDVLLKMTRVEALALPPLEAFHAGCTSIISRVTGSEEYVQDGMNALYVEVDDFRALKEILTSIEADPSVIPKLKAGAISTASHWPDIKSTALEFASICYTILASESLGNRPITEPATLLMQARTKIENSNFLKTLLLNLSNQ